MTNKPQQQKIIPINALQITTPKQPDIPQSESAERSLIGAMLLNPYIIPAVATALDDDAWFYLRYSMVYDAMLALSDGGIAIDTVTLSDHMRNTPCSLAQHGHALDFVSGPALFTQLISECPTSAHYMDYITIVNATYRRRCMAIAAADMHAAALNNDIEFSKVVNTAYGILDRLNDKTRTFTTIGDALHKHMDIAEERRANPIEMGIPSGITSLDKRIDGFHKRRVYIIAARKQHGKTALLSTIALHAASEGVRVGFFNVADGNGQDVTSRSIAIASGVNSHEVLMGRCDAQEYSLYSEAARKVSQYPIYIESEKGMCLPELLVKARNIKYRYGLDMLIIDYIQRIGIDTTKRGAPQQRPEQLAYISRTITKLAEEEYLDIPILVGAQLNRGADGHRPGIADIKGSGAIEEDADCIIMPYRENFNKERMELIVAVNKITGRTGTIDVDIDRTSTKIENIKW